MENEELNKQHAAFLDEYFKNGFNGRQAYLKTYEGVTNETAEVNASKLLSLTKVKNELQRRQKEIQIRNNISVDEIISELKTLIVECKTDNDRKNLLKTLDQLAKMIGAYAPKQIENIGGNSIQINIINPE